MKTLPRRSLRSYCAPYQNGSTVLALQLMSSGVVKLISFSNWWDDGYWRQVYEALRAGPKWNNTLLLITYDEHGGFFVRTQTQASAFAAYVLSVLALSSSCRLLLLWLPTVTNGQTGPRAAPAVPQPRRPQLHRPALRLQAPGCASSRGEWLSVRHRVHCCGVDGGMDAWHAWMQGDMWACVFVSSWFRHSLVCMLFPTVPVALHTLLACWFLSRTANVRCTCAARLWQVAISPYTAKGTVVNEPTPVSPTEGVHYEHSSVPKSLHALFAPNAAPLTAREVFAAPFHTAVLNLDEPRTDCPMTLPTPTSHRELSQLGPVDGHRAMTGLQVPWEQCLVPVWLSQGCGAVPFFGYLCNTVLMSVSLCWCARVCVCAWVHLCPCVHVCVSSLWWAMPCQVELAAVGAAMVGDPLSAIEPLETEQQGAEYVAGCVNKLFGRTMIRVPKSADDV